MSDRMIYEDAQVNIVELLGSGDKDSIESMLVIYRQLFPKYSHYAKRMRRRSSAPPEARPGHIAHYWLIEVDSKPVGVCTFRYIHRRKCGAGIAFGLDDSVRSVRVKDVRLSEFVISMVMEQLAKDSQAMGESDYWGLVTEVEHRELMEHYKRMGMFELPIKYIEPVFPPENGQHSKESLEPASFEPVILGITPNPKIEFREYDSDTLADFSLAFLVDHYGLPEDHEVVRSVLESIHGYVGGRNNV